MAGDSTLSTEEMQFILYVSESTVDARLHDHISRQECVGMRLCVHLSVTFVVSR